MKVVNLCSPTSKVEAKNLRHIRCPLPRFGGGAPKLAAFYNTKYNNKCSKSNKIHDGCRNILKQMKRLDVDEKGSLQYLIPGRGIAKRGWAFGPASSCSCRCILWLRRRVRRHL